MDNLNTISFITSLTSSLLYGTYKSYIFCKKRIKKNTFIILMSSTTGIQELINETDNHENIVPVVVNDVLDNYLNEDEKNELERNKCVNKILYNILVLKHLKSYIRELKSYNKKSVFVVFTTQLELLKSLKVNNNNICVLLPSIKYNHKIQYRLDEDEQVNNLERREMLYNTNYEKLVFNNKQELTNHLVNILNPLKK